jgi:hypothetical protein
LNIVMKEINKPKYYWISLLIIEQLYYNNLVM